MRISLCRGSTQPQNVWKISVGMYVLKEYLSWSIVLVLQWVPNYPNPDYPNSPLSERLDVAMFSAAAGKIRSGHWSSATGESKPAVRTTFPACYNTFFSQYGI